MYVYDDAEYPTYGDLEDSTHTGDRPSTYEDPDYWSTIDANVEHWATALGEHLVTALNGDQPHSWTDPDTGNEITVTPTWWYFGRRGRYCRGFTKESLGEGHKDLFYGKACRQSNGTWDIVE